MQFKNNYSHLLFISILYSITSKDYFMLVLLFLLVCSDIPPD